MIESKGQSILIDPQTKEMSLSISDKIKTLDMMSWASMGATLTTFWQIIIPFVLFPLNKPQLILGITSVGFFLISLLVIFWSNNGYQYLKKFNQSQQGLENSNNLVKTDNPPLPSWHVEGAIYVTSFFLIAIYASCFFGIYENKGYSSALLAARGIDYINAYKEAIIIIYCQMLLIIIDIIILAYYVKYAYHLEFYPMHLPAQLGWFLVGFIFMCSMTIGDTNYLPSQIGPINHLEIEEAKSSHSSIFWNCLIGICVTLFFLFEQRSIQQEQVPKVRFYFLPFLLLILLGTMIISDSLNFLYASTQSVEKMKTDCKSTMQNYASTYINKIGCPSKYKTFTLQGTDFYDQICPTEEVGIVWEPELTISVNEKSNQLACMNLNCCFLVSEERSLFYKQYFLYSLLTAFIGFIGAGHCFDIALQSPQKIKAGPSVYTQTKYVLQIIIACFSIFLGVYLSFKYEVKHPSTLPTINNSPFINNQIQLPPIKNKFQSIPQCQQLLNNKGLAYQVHFDPTLCDSDRKCDSQNQGFKVCISTINSIIQIEPTWQNKDATIYGTNVYDPYAIQQVLKGAKLSDKFCALGLQDAINDLFSKYVYICTAPGKTSQITFSANQQLVNLQGNEDSDEETMFSIISHRKYHQQQQQQGDDSGQSKAFATLEFTVIDSEEYFILINAEINVYQDAKKCVELLQQVYYPIRQSKTNDKGISILYHVPVIRDLYYNIQIRADGYYYNCLITDKFKLFQVNSFIVPLTKLLPPQFAMKIMLWYQDPSITLELGANVVQQSTIECHVSFFNQECNQMKYTNSFKSHKLKVSRVITLKQILKFNYLFYMRHLPTDHDILQVVNNKALSLTITQQGILSKDLQKTLKSHPKISIYTNGNLFPNQIYQMPITQSEIDTTPNLLYWLAFCMDGKIGPSTETPLNHFWEKKDGNQYWQRRTVTPQGIPNSQICDNKK